MFYPKSPFPKDQITKTHLFLDKDLRFYKLLRWICLTPVITTYRINTLYASAEQFKNTFQSILSAKYNPAPEVFLIDEIPEVVCISNLKQRKPTLQSDLKEVMVDVICGAALLRGAHVFGPGVMSMQPDTKIGETVNVFADFEGKCRKGKKTVYHSDQKIFIGTGIVKMQREKLFENNSCYNKGIAIEMNSTISGVPSIGDMSSGLALLQNFPSIICTRVLDPQEGEVILDMCSAPGNKTTHIAELMGNRGVVIGLDKTKKKADFARKKAEIHQLSSVKIYHFDSVKALQQDSEVQLDGPPFAPATFDRILVDAPCSGLGNRPVLLNTFTSRTFTSFTVVQKNLLTNAVGLLKPNGILVYSTCTINQYENEQIVSWLLGQFSEMELVEATPIFGGPGLNGSDLTDEQRRCVQRFGPTEYNRNQIVDSIAFFIAKFIKSRSK